MRLLMIPAFACDGDLYTPTVELLRPDFDCTTLIARQPSIAASAREVLAAAGAEPFLLWGTSLGAHVAREMAVLAPERVAGLIVSGATPAPPPDPTAFERRRASILADGGSLALEEMAQTIVFEPEGRGQAAADRFRIMSARQPRELLLAQNEALATRTDRRDTLPAIACPTLLLWGADDRYSPPEAARAMAAAMPRARLVVLEDCGHLPSLEAAMRSVAEIRAAFVEPRASS